ncbi:ATP-binding protein [Roseovarius aestuariivivens]|uniref:ATP-binding protein n=1 Tax=Roseovarius aestuariivivens TaxID=1888910 RepID=UPI0010804884|nr:ATP-binding protein [Roseovarius aestuariivivens]
MTAAPTPERDALYKRVYLYAALHESFAPMEALSWAAGGRLPDDLHLTSEILSLLRPHCMPDPAARPDQPTWIMRPAARHYALDETRIETDVVTDFDTDLADARLGRGPFAPAALDARIAAGDPAPDIAHIAGTLDRAGPHAPGADRVTALRALMNRAEAQARTDALLTQGLKGRETELDAIAEALAAPLERPPVTAVTISGLAGIGKSSLLDYAIERARLVVAPVVVRLDFDRAGLDLRDARSFYDEISRQVGDALPGLAADLRARRLAAAPRQIALTRLKETTKSVPETPLIELVTEMMRAINAEGRLLLVALDTMEVLRAEGESRIALLFERLDRLFHAGLERMVVLAAGRGRFMDPAPKRIRGATLFLDGLEDNAARAVLAGEGVPEMLWSDILRLAQGNPLFLRLAARAVPGGAIETGDLPKGAPPEAVAGVLYRAILSRVPEPLRQMAAMGLLLRELSRESVARVLAPSVAPDATRAQLDRSFAALAKHTWLVSEDVEAGILRHHEDVRRAFLSLLYADAPERCAEIDARAERFFEETGRPELALYHRLQLMRDGRAAPGIDAAVARQLPPSAAEDLPPAARDVLRQAQGLRSDFARAGATKVKPRGVAKTSAVPDHSEAFFTGPGPVCRFDTARDRLLLLDTPDTIAPDARALRDLARSLAGHDLREAEFIVQNGLQGEIPAGSPAGRLVLCHLWLTGRWSSARRLFRALPEDALDQALEEAPALQGRILLDIEAEFRFDALVRRLRGDSNLAMRAIAVRRDAGRAGLSGGALDMALLTALPTDALPHQELDTAFGLLAHNGGEARQAEERLHYLARAEMTRHGLYVGPIMGNDPDAKASATRELAVLNPYARRQMAMLLRAPRGALETFFADAHGLPRAAAAHYAPHVENADDALSRNYPLPRDLLRAFHAMGLAAEWSEGFTLFNPVADLPLLAECSERWRRAVAGDWAYGRQKPAEWTGTTGPDRVTIARAKKLFEDDSSADAARAELYFWSQPTHTPAEAARHLQRRFRDRYEKCLFNISSDIDPLAALSQALGNFHSAEVTGIAAAPLAVLAARGVPADSAFTPPD